MVETIKSCLREPRNIDEMELKIHAEARIRSLVKALGERCNSFVLVEHKSFFKELDKEWREVVKHELRVGRRCKRIMLQKIGDYKIDYYIKEKFDFSLIHVKGSYKRMNYAFHKFLDLAKMEVAMLLAKYDGNELMEFEIEIAIVEILIDYFEMYVEEFNYENDKYVWRIQPNDIRTCLDKLLQMPMKELKPYTDHFDKSFHLHKRIRVVEDDFKRHKKPQNVNDILILRAEGMTDTEFTNAIANYWGVSERTARSWKKEFGCSRKYKKNNTEQQNDLTTELKKRVSELEQQNAELTLKNDQLKKKNAKMIETLPSSFYINMNLALKAEIDNLSRENELLRKELKAIKPKSA